MQTLVFNTTNRKVTLYSKYPSDIHLEYSDVPTVKVREGFYEVMQKDEIENRVTVPVLRVPITNTNMIIEK